MRRWACPVTEILAFATEILVTGLEIFLCEHSSPVNYIGMKLERSHLVHLGN